MQKPSEESGAAQQKSGPNKPPEQAPKKTTHEKGLRRLLPSWHVFVFCQDLSSDGWGAQFRLGQWAFVWGPRKKGHSLPGLVVKC